MFGALENFHPVVQALAAGVFAWALGALGAACVFIRKEFSQRVLDAMLGFAGGIMIAATFWSLLAPAIEMSGESAMLSWIPAAAGFLLGAVSLRVIDKVLPHLHLSLPITEAEGIRTSWQRSVLLVLAIALHNIPEGLAIGVAIGAAAALLPGETGPAAMALVLGMGIHNIPEGLAVSLSLRREGMSKFRSFWYGQLSSIVFPIAACLGVLAVIRVGSLLPYALGFAAGAMIFVVVEEVIPESQRNGHTDLATAGTIIGFLTMMALDALFS